jgi:tetratricopeptide (TPR) repeat protein
MVLGMKTEKLEKAQTAYLAATKMSPDPKIQADSFAGIDRCYSHYVEALEQLQPPPSFSEEDRKALKSEIAKILVPIREKRDENRKQGRSLASAAAPADAGAIRWEDLSGDASPSPRAPTQWTFLKPYVPENWSDDAAKIDRLVTSKKYSCDSKKPEFGRCFMAGKLDVAEKVAREMTQQKDHRVRGWHHLALVADARGLQTKALWLLRLAEKEKSDHALVNFEKGRLLSEIEGKAAGSTDFAEVLATSMTSTEIEILKGFKAFSEGDSTTVKSVFGAFSKTELYHQRLELLLSESIAQTGDPDKALKVLTDAAPKNPDADQLIQIGRLYEVYKFAPVPALEAYQKAAKLAKDPAQKDWLSRKTEYLKVNFKVGLHVPSEG